MTIEEKKKIFEYNKKVKNAANLIMEESGVLVELSGIAGRIVLEINKELNQKNPYKQVGWISGKIEYPIELLNGYVAKVTYRVFNVNTKNDVKIAKTNLRGVKCSFNRVTNEITAAFYSIVNKIPINDDNVEPLAHELEHLYQREKIGVKGKLVNNERLYNFAISEINMNGLGSFLGDIAYAVYVTDWSEMNAMIQQFSIYLEHSEDKMDYDKSKTYAAYEFLLREKKKLKNLPLETKVKITERYRPYGITFSGILKRIGVCADNYKYKIGQVMRYHFGNSININN